MAARIPDSDMDLAFRLQLEEAIAASLSFQPSSSTLPQPQPPPPPLTNDGPGFFPDLQTLELEKLDTETQDCILIESETKRMHEDFHRRVHDQKLAREILHMPEDEWQEVGDNFHRPYGEGPSSSSSSKKSATSDEIFRVYFKGLLSEERIGKNKASQKTVTLAGIGVAICDSGDELIFEMSKPLDSGKGVRMSRQSVEREALIEALNAAAALHLNSIVFCCDYYTIYQFVTGRWPPKQPKVQKFVNDVKSLQEKFKHCVPSLVARKDVKFAFELARKAIVSQIKISADSSHDKLENCVICLEDISSDQFFLVDHCEHRYCFSCMKQHVEVKLRHGMLPKCPHEGCESELKVESCKIFLTPKLLEMMCQRLQEASIPVTEKIYCPYPKCSALMSRTEALENSRLPLVIDLHLGARRCKKCRRVFCANCKVPWHKDMTCAEYKRRNPTPLVEESKLKNLAARNLWRQCVRCKHMIELAAGCYHMTCRCGYEFCYTCGAEWKNKKATCACPLWHEENIVDDEYEDDDFDDEDDDDDYNSDSDEDYL